MDITIKSSAPTGNLIKQPLPSDLLNLTRKQLRSILAERYSVPENCITLHGRPAITAYSVYRNGKPRISWDELNSIARQRRSKREIEEAKQERARLREEKRLRRITEKTKRRELRKEADRALHRRRAEDKGILHPQRRRGKAQGRTYLSAAWKQEQVPDTDDEIVWAACEDPVTRNILVAAANTAEDLLTKTRDGYLSANAIRTNTRLAAVLRLEHGKALLPRILKRLKVSYVKGSRTQQYTLGPAVPYLLRLQEQFNIPNPTFETSVEQFNKHVEMFASEKGFKTVRIGDILYAEIKGRFYNKLVNSPRSLLIRRMKALGYTVDPSVITLIDIEASLPTEMNLLACRLDRRLRRPTTKEQKSAREVTAIAFNIPLRLAKAIHNASLCGSPIGIRSDVWDDYEVDFTTKLAIAKSKEIRYNREVFKQNIRLFKAKGCFDYVPDRESMTDAQLYSLLYCELEGKRMRPVHEYLASQNMPFVNKHDGVDVFCVLTDEQKEEIRKIIGIDCSIEEVPITINDPSKRNGSKNIKQLGEAHYVVVQHSEKDLDKQAEDQPADTVEISEVLSNGNTAADCEE